MIQTEELKQLLDLSAEQISLPFTLLNLFFCFVVSMIIRSYYINFSNSLTGKLHLGLIIPLLSSAVFLVIVIVKSSLSLSLGLVGALSIVRFRTPIKEPEELVYLFLSISLGLGFGAGHPLITSTVVLLILVFNYLFLKQKKTIKTNEYNLIIEIDSNELKFNNLIEKISGFCDSIKFIRVDSDKNNHSVVLLISIKGNSSIEDLLSQIQNDYTTASLFESNTNW